MTKELLSIVLPCYNEEENVPLVYKAIIDVVDKRRFALEIIFVNDGSSDGTWQAIESLAKHHSEVQGITFSRNFGNQAAHEAGLTTAKGDMVIMMDADLQHPPNLIPSLITEYDKGYDVVNTVRLRTENTSIVKKLTSQWFYGVLNSISDLKLRDGESDYRLMSRRALDTLNALPESPKFYRGLINWIGYPVARVEYEAPARIHGTSSFTMKKLIDLARLGLTSFSIRPLKAILTLGIGTTVLSTIVLSALIVIKLLYPLLVSYSAILTVVVLLAVGILTVFQGIIAMYLIDVFNATKNRPTYIVGETVGVRKDD